MIEIDKNEINVLRLKILKDLKSFCEQHGLTYFLTYSSLLGAVRGKSFIPWNNNAGIMLRREDYETLCRKFNEWASEHAPNEKTISAVEAFDYGLPFIKVIDTNTVLVEKNGYGPSVGVAVFPIDGMGNDKAVAEKRMKKIETYSTALIYKVYGAECGLRPTLKAKIISKAKRKTALLLKIDKLCKKHDCACSSFLAVPFGQNAVKAIMPKEVFESGEAVTLESEEFSAPKGYDRYLQALYGDYMSLPVEKERKEKEYRVFKKNKENDYGTYENC